jgi:hypothetical protein
MIFCLAGGCVGHEAADACVVAWMQRWGEGWVPDLGIIAGCGLGMALGFALMRSLRDALALVRSAPPAGGEHPSGAQALSHGLITLSLLATLGALAAAGFGGFRWREVSPPGGGFRVMMPGRPVEEVEEEKTPQGRATGSRFVSRGCERGYELARLHVYGVTFLDYPPGYLTRRSPAEVFRAQRDALTRSEGRLVSEKSVSLSGFPGTELRIEADDGGVIACRLFLVRQRLYLVMARYPRTNPGPGVRAFFDSFAITGH